jgi:GT2 family glycosyltransferase
VVVYLHLDVRLLLTLCLTGRKQFILHHRTSRPLQDAVEVPMIIGSCYMMSRSSYDKVGGFCPLFRGWGADDVDISIRAWMSGLGVKCITNAAVGHLYRSKFPYHVEYDHLEFNPACDD